MSELPNDKPTESGQPLTPTSEQSAAPQADLPARVGEGNDLSSISFRVASDFNLPRAKRQLPEPLNRLNGRKSGTGEQTIGAADKAAADVNDKSARELEDGQDETTSDAVASSGTKTAGANRPDVEPHISSAISGDEKSTPTSIPQISDASHSIERHGDIIKPS